MCALYIGDADNLDNFIGEIDEVRNNFSVFRCKKFFLKISVLVFEANLCSYWLHYLKMFL